MPTTERENAALAGLHDAVSRLLTLYSPLQCQYRFRRAGPGCPGTPGPCVWCRLAAAHHAAGAALVVSKSTGTEETGP